MCLRGAMCWVAVVLGGCSILLTESEPDAGDTSLIDAQPDALRPPECNSLQGHYLSSEATADCRHISITSEVTINTTTKTVTGATFSVESIGEVVKIHADTIIIGARLDAVGTQPLLIAANRIVIESTGVVDVSSSAEEASRGAGSNVDCGTAAGGPTMVLGGAGGGAFRGTGGDGADSSGGLVLDSVLFRGGCPGGGSPQFVGGGGGGAVYLLSPVLEIRGAVLAGGAGGGSGGNFSGGGGGGSGGMIVLDSPNIVVTGTLAANGGGGATGGTNSAAGTTGKDSTMPTAAQGGQANGGGGLGGAGSGIDVGTGDRLDGMPGNPGGATESGGGGGGGGGAGFIVAPTLVPTQNGEVYPPIQIFPSSS